MHLPNLAFPVALSGVILIGCSGGSSAGSKSERCFTPGATFCLTSCNLGCTQTGCSITDIAQNQSIQLKFSQPLDPSSVNAASISLRTPSGVPPTGQLIVQGQTILFVPDIKIVSGQTLFGFRANETYILTLPGGPNEAQALRSTSGDSLSSLVTCTLTVSRGIIDLDGQPPKPTLLLPTDNSGVDPDTTIVVDFSEIIDVAPFQGATTATSPILYRVRATRPAAGGGVECDVTRPAADLGGVPRAIIDPIAQTTQVILKPTVSLPGDACIEVVVTSRVRDLSGKSAVPTQYSFTTKDVPKKEQSLAEDFRNAAKYDPDRSSGVWLNGATAGLVGGDGHLGDFDATYGTQLSPGVFEWNTDGQIIPASATVSGVSELVDDGVFEFATFDLPAGTTLVFTGSSPPRIMVRGSVSIKGNILLNASDQPLHDKDLAMGQAGGSGAIFGGMGGKGADKADGISPLPQFSGSDGEDVQLPAGHAYAGRATDTGGKGSQQYPTSGRWQDITFDGLQGIFSAQIAAGGGGGGLFTAGGTGQAVATTPPSMELGPPAMGGVAFDLFPIPAGIDSIDHFMVGGSGGGGGGGHPFFATSQGASTEWRSGAGGAGGGGVIAFRIGGDLTMTATGSIEVRGGSGPEAGAPPPAPGGGGSGGTALLQVGGTPSLGGTIDARGGMGGFTLDTSGVFQLETRGGDGAPGIIRLEVDQANPPVSLLGSTLPAATTQNVSQLLDRDDVVGSESLWYATRQIFPPEFLRYELQVVEDGVQVVYSDDASWTSSFGPNVGVAGSSAPVQFLIQGARVNPTTGQVDASTIKPWRQFVGPKSGQMSLDGDDATGYRFQLIFNLGLGKNVVVRKLLVYFKA